MTLWRKPVASWGNPPNATSLTILEQGTIPWGGVEDFCKFQQGSSASAADASNEDPNSEASKDLEDWAHTYVIVEVEYGTASLHNNDATNPLPLTHYFDSNDKALYSIYAKDMRNVSLATREVQHLCHLSQHRYKYSCGFSYE